MRVVTFVDLIDLGCGINLGRGRFAVVSLDYYLLIHD